MSNTNAGQTEMVLDYMRKFGEITPLDALADLGIMRLASRISELRKRGIGIKVDRKSGKNRFGKQTHYAVYSLVI